MKAKELLVQIENNRIDGCSVFKEGEKLQKELEAKEKEIQRIIKTAICGLDGVSSDAKIMFQFLFGKPIVDISNYSFHAYYNDGDIIIETKGSSQIHLSFINELKETIESVLKEEI